MTEKYGPPAKDNTKWLGSMFKSNDTSNYGKAIILGQVSFSHVWRDKIETAIVLQLQNINKTILLSSTYLPESIVQGMTIDAKNSNKDGY